jgi:hypothetical protein
VVGEDGDGEAGTHGQLHVAGSQPESVLLEPINRETPPMLTEIDPKAPAAWATQTSRRWGRFASTRQCSSPMNLRNRMNPRAMMPAG